MTPLIPLNTHASDQSRNFAATLSNPRSVHAVPNMGRGSEGVRLGFSDLSQVVINDDRTIVVHRPTLLRRELD
jgi:hypothetical protein